MSGVSKGKKAIEEELIKLAAEANLTSISCTWQVYNTDYYLIASFGEYSFEWPFSKVQLEESSSGYVSSYISRTLWREMNSLVS